MLATMPHSAPRTVTPSSSMPSEKCDCAHYRTQGMACPCSVEFAAKTSKRAMERILHKSAFFDPENISANLELQSESEAAAGRSRTVVTNKVVQVETRHVEVGPLLGKGGFCLVHDADIILPHEQPHEKHDYCVKFLKPSILPDRKKFARGMADLAIEAHFLSVLNHPNIIKIRGITAGVTLFKPSIPILTNQPGADGGYFLVLDKLHSTLDRKIDYEWKTADHKYNSFLYRTTHDLRGSKRRGLKLERIEVAIQLAKAMQYLHEHQICYRDLKPDNVGFDAENNLKIFDFGLAKELKPYKRHDDGTYHLTANTGSRRYMAPEVALRKRYNLSVDVFSFSILLWEMCALEKPFDGFSEMQHMNLVVQRGFRPKLDILRSWPNEMKMILNRGWSASWLQRSTFREIVGSLMELKRELESVI